MLVLPLKATSFILFSPVLILFRVVQNFLSTVDPLLSSSKNRRATPRNVEPYPLEERKAQNANNLDQKMRRILFNNEDEESAMWSLIEEVEMKDVKPEQAKGGSNRCVL